MKKLIKLGNIILCTCMINIYLTGCSLYGSSNKTWVNYQYKHGTVEYKQALSDAWDTCADFAFKDGIRIDGVTYYDYDSATEADKNYRWERAGIYPRQPVSHERQLNYFLNRKYKCLANKGWYFEKAAQEL